MTSKATSTTLGPDMGLIADHLWAYGRTRALQAATELGFFDALVAGPLSAVALAKALRSTERGVRMLGDALCALSLLEKSKGGYALNATSGAFLVSTSPGYMGKMILHTRRHDHAWASLDFGASGPDIVVGVMKG